MSERRHRHLPSVADASDQVLLRNLRVGEEHLVKRGVAVHLFERLNVDARLLDVNHEIRETLVLGRVPIGASEQHAMVGMMRAGGPYLLSVDDPKVSLQIRACGGAGEVGAAARLAEELAPGVFPGEDTAQKFFLLQIRSVLEQGGRRQHSHSGSRNAHGAHLGANSSSTTRASACGRPRPYHSLGHCGMPHPESASLLRHSTSDISGSQFAASQSRTSARTLCFVDLAHRSNSPALHQELPVVTWLTEEHLRAFGALEPQMGVVFPGEADAAMNLNTFGRSMQVRFRRGSFGQTGERGPFGIVQRGGLSCVIGR